jgi:hypothetical protein
MKKYKEIKRVHATGEKELPIRVIVDIDRLAWKQTNKKK